jgi:hypothetical protein
VLPLLAPAGRDLERRENRVCIGQEYTDSGLFSIQFGTARIRGSSASALAWTRYAADRAGNKIRVEVKHLPTPILLDEKGRLDWWFGGLEPGVELCWRVYL